MLHDRVCQPGSVPHFLDRSRAVRALKQTQLHHCTSPWGWVQASAGQDVDLWTSLAWWAPWLGWAGAGDWPHSSLAGIWDDGDDTVSWARGRNRQGLGVLEGLLWGLQVPCISVGEEMGSPKLPRESRWSQPVWTVPVQRAVGLRGKGASLTEKSQRLVGPEEERPELHMGTWRMEWAASGLGSFSTRACLALAYSCPWQGHYL